MATAVARVPGVMAAAAALATAATSVDFPDMLHHAVFPVLLHAANPSLLPNSTLSSSSSFPSAASALTSAKWVSSANLGPCISHPLARRTSNVGHELSAVKAQAYLSPLSRSSGASCTSFSRGIFPAKGCHCLSQLAFSSPSALSPSFLYSTYQLPHDELHRAFRVEAWKSTATASHFTASAHSKVPASSGSLLSFLSFDLSSHLASLSSYFSSPSHPSAISSKCLHRWHTPAPGAVHPDDQEGESISKRPVLTVVLLGWLGSQQKHLKKYAEWYNARGIQAVTFTVPMADIISLSMGGKAEEHVDQLTNHLSMWLAEKSQEDEGSEKHLIFHTFSNTGWLTYGLVLEKLSSRGDPCADRIKGCVVDSAPAADPDPQVWASGFSAALLKKRSSASKGDILEESGAAGSTKPVVNSSEPDVAESALLAFLERFFCIFLQIPAISQRLSQVVAVLSEQQPPCPQLYIYSTADKVIPVNCVESFMEKQRQEGRVVRGCNFESSPHVDHFRSFPDIYGNQVSNFLQECLHRSSHQ